jgi:hypothetical protein
LLLKSFCCRFVAYSIVKSAEEVKEPAKGKTAETAQVKK